MVPAVEVLAMIHMIQCTLCLLGKASELISQMRCIRILEVVDPSWSRYGSEEFPSSSDTLFGEGFQGKLSKKVERDTALSKAISITKQAKKDDQATSSRRVEHRMPQFFQRYPPARYESRQGKYFLLYNAQLSNRQREHGQPGHQGPSSQPKHGQFPLYHKPLSVRENPTEEVLRFLPQLSRDELENVGFEADMTLDSAHHGPSQRPAITVPGELDEAHRRPLGLADNHGEQNRV